MISIESVEAGLDHIRGAARRIERELRNVQDRAREQRDELATSVQKRAETRLREAGDQAEALRRRVVAQVESALEENPVVGRVADLRKGAGERIAQGLERAFAALPIASRREVEQLDRKLKRVQRKLRNMEKAQTA